MLTTWNADPKSRPTFDDLRNILDQMLTSSEKENYINLLVDEDLPYYNVFPQTAPSQESFPSGEENPSTTSPPSPSSKELDHKDIEENLATKEDL